MPRKKKETNKVEIVETSQNVKVLVNGRVKKTFPNRKEAEEYIKRFN